jgi:hypothetical protein
MLKNNIILLMGIAGSGKMTIGEAIAQQDPHFKFISPHDWLDPLLKLLKDDESVWWLLDEKGWAVVNQANDVVLNMIADVCPKESNFAISYEMLANNPYHQNYFERVQNAATRRDATLTPVRLICDLEELLERVQAKSRIAYFKTRDVELIKKRFADNEVFFSHLPNELTLDVTDITPKESAEKILEWVAELK